MSKISTQKVIELLSKVILVNPPMESNGHGEFANTHYIGELNLIAIEALLEQNAEKPDPITNNERFITSNGIQMIRSTPLSWEYHSPGDLYTINIGSLDQMFQASYRPATKIVSFVDTGFDAEGPAYRFKVNSLEEATLMTYNFAVGMGRLHNLEGTIYFD